jgi:urease alpha subunit
MTTIGRRLRRDVRPDRGDRLRLADTELVIEVEHDFTRSTARK